MGIRRGSISTPIIADGLVFNMDAANRASYVPNANTSYNTTNLSISGSLYNDTSYIAPPTSASCWAFDGTDDYIDCGTNSSLMPTNAITLSGWAKHPSTTSNSPLPIISQDHPAYAGTYNGYRIKYRLQSTGNIYSKFELGDGTSTQEINLPPDPGYIVGTWNHITGTWDGAMMRLYVNAIEKATLSFTGTINYNTAVFVGIGTQRTIVDFAGNIANVQIYNRALSANEVLHNYDALKGRFA